MRSENIDASNWLEGWQGEWEEQACSIAPTERERCVGTCKWTRDKTKSHTELYESVNRARGTELLRSVVSEEPRETEGGGGDVDETEDKDEKRLRRDYIHEWEAEWEVSVHLCHVTWCWNAVPAHMVAMGMQHSSKKERKTNSSIRHGFESVSRKMQRHFESDQILLGSNRRTEDAFFTFSLRWRLLSSAYYPPRCLNNVKLQD